jgi:hypothetical protein
MGGGISINRRTGGSGGSLSLTLHTDYYERKYLSSSVCSWAFIFHIFVLFTLIVLPFVLTFSSGGKQSQLIIACNRLLGEESQLLRIAEGHL